MIIHRIKRRHRRQVVCLAPRCRPSAHLGCPVTTSDQLLATTPTTDQTLEMPACRRTAGGSLWLAPAASAPGLTSGNHGDTFLTPPPHTWKKLRNSYLSLLVRVRFSSFPHLLLLSPFLFPFVLSVQVAAAALLLLLPPAPASISLPPTQVDSTSCCPPHPVSSCLVALGLVASHRIVPQVARPSCLQCRNKLSQLAFISPITLAAAAATATATSAPTSHGRLSTPWHEPASPAAGTRPSWLRRPAGQHPAAHAAACARARHHPAEHEPNPDCHQLAHVGRGHVPDERWRLCLHPAPRRA